MKMNTPSFHSDPHVQYLTQVLEEISDGFIQIPRFQRPLVWDWDRRLELLRSIRDGIPMGAIMVWRSTTAKIDCYKFLGPHQLREPSKSSNPQYLLDGVQRLSTLYGALHQSDTELEDLLFDDVDDGGQPSESFEVMYDLRKKDFVRKSQIDDGPAMMPLRIVFDSVLMLRFQRELSELDDFEDLVAASESVAKSFREYKIPIIPIVTDSTEMATKTFQRINSQGEPMNEAHMIHALSWDGSFDLNRRLDEVKREFLLPIGWQDIDSDILIKACKAKLGFDIYRTNADAIGQAFRKNPEVLNEVGLGLREAAAFLESTCGICIPQLVPYTLQLVILADVFSGGGRIDASTEVALRDWFWATTYGEIFAGMSGDNFDNTLKSVRRKIAAADPPYFLPSSIEIRPYPARFDFRSVRAKAFGFRLAEKRNEVMGDNSGTKILTEFGSASLVQPLKRSENDKSIYSMYSHRFLLHPSEVSGFRANLSEARITHQDMMVHFVDEISLAALRQSDHSAFLTHRLRKIQEFDDAFISSIAGIAHQDERGSVLE